MIQFVASNLKTCTAGSISYVFTALADFLYQIHENVFLIRRRNVVLNQNFLEKINLQNQPLFLHSPH